MLFNSYAFIFLYLPLVAVGFFQLARISAKWAAGWLTLASLFFYGYWNPVYVLLLVASILANYLFGAWIARHSVTSSQAGRWPLAISITANLALLAYFKYANFLVTSVNAVFDTGLSTAAVVLPLGISFFTFTQIAFLVDTFQGKVRERNFIHYALFVTYFPHLIAGPVLHHKEMMPQFALASTYRFNYENLAVGLTIFVIGLFKKVVLADSLSPYANSVFDAAYAGTQPGFLDAWMGALAYSLQLYFDFSGYSDMAIGLSRIFGIVLPINFDSPYQSTSIIEFWRRWHITLSRFLRDYLYIPLGGNRYGSARRYLNLMLTMLLGGLWHGAGWTFVVWGALHGFYLLINHVWVAIRNDVLQWDDGHSWAGRAAAWCITFTAVVVAWVLFRAADLRTAGSILASMTGANGVELPGMLATVVGPAVTKTLEGLGVVFANAGVFSGSRQFVLVAVWMLIALVMPNTSQVTRHYRPVLVMPERPLRLAGIVWQPSWAWVAFAAAVSVTALLLMRPSSDFLYFQF